MFCLETAVAAVDVVNDDESDMSCLGCAAWDRDAVAVGEMESRFQRLRREELLSFEEQW